jgi:hypothetical protein
MSPLLELITDRGAHYPMHARITAYLDPPDIFNLSQTSKAHSNIYNDTKKTHWSVGARLNYFFTNVQAFRNVQAQSGALIGGRFALDFFKRRPISAHSTSQMDLCVEVGANTDMITEYLMAEGYKVRPDDDDAEHHIMFVKGSTTDDSSGPRICMHSKPMSPIITVLRHSLTTADMNFLSSHKAYCLFPIQTLLEEAAYLMKPVRKMNEPSDILIRKKIRQLLRTSYKVQEPDSGFHMTGKPEHKRALSGLRQAGDRYSWVIDLDTTNVQPPSRPEHILEFATFGLWVTGLSPYDRPNSDKNFTQYYAASTTNVRSPVLKHTYAIDIEHQHPKVEDLVKALNDRFYLQVALMEPEDRPEEFETFPPVRPRYEIETIDGFTPPVFWNYCDDDVMSLLRAVRTKIDDRHDNAVKVSKGLKSEDDLVNEMRDLFYRMMPEIGLPELRNI